MKKGLRLEASYYRLLEDVRFKEVAAITYGASKQLEVQNKYDVLLDDLDQLYLSDEKPNTDDDV